MRRYNWIYNRLVSLYVCSYRIFELSLKDLAEVFLEPRTEEDPKRLNY